jgi:hypothetical protein
VHILWLCWAIDLAHVLANSFAINNIRPCYCVGNALRPSPLLCNAFPSQHLSATLSERKANPFAFPSPTHSKGLSSPLHGIGTPWRTHGEASALPLCAPPERGAKVKRMAYAMGSPSGTNPGEHKANAQHGLGTPERMLSEGYERTGRTQGESYLAKHPVDTP